jgi:hypothetical protein
MSVKGTAAVGFGIIIKGNDVDAVGRVIELGDEFEADSIEAIPDAAGFQHLMIEAAGSLLFGYDKNDLVIVVKDTYREFDIMSSGFAGAFRIDENGVSEEGINELREFCAKTGLETAAFWMAWNAAS